MLHKSFFFYLFFKFVSVGVPIFSNFEEQKKVYAFFTVFKLVDFPIVSPENWGQFQKLLRTVLFSPQLNPKITNELA